MAAARVDEAYSERDETIDADGNVTEIAIHYLVFDAADEDAALAAARTKAKAKTVAGMALDSVEVEERVNVTMPVFNFEETHTLSGTVVTDGWKKKVASITGTVNSGAFRGFEAGEVLFLGASGSKRSKKKSANWEITFRFAVSANVKSLKVGDLTVENKRGWDYLWVSYKTAVAANGRSLVKKPSAAYVEKVYPDGDFGTLGI